MSFACNLGLVHAEIEELRVLLDRVCYWKWFMFELILFFAE